MTHEMNARPKARFFAFVALMWAGVAFVGAVMLWLDTSWELDSVEIRRLAWWVVIPEPVFLGLAIFFRLVERPRKVTAPREWEGPVVH